MTGPREDAARHAWNRRYACTRSSPRPVGPWKWCAWWRRFGMDMAPILAAGHLESNDSFFTRIGTRELRILRGRPLLAGSAAFLLASASQSMAPAAASRPIPLPSPTLRAASENGALVLELGPVELPANAGHDQVKQPPPLVIAVPRDGWISGYSIEIVDDQGRRLPQVVLHHVNVIAPGKRELFSDIMLRVAAAGTETAPLSMPSIVGYRVHRGDSLLVSAMLHNPTPRSYVATLRVRFPFKPASSTFGAVGVYPFYLDVMPPAGSHSFDVPVGHSEHYWEGRSAVDGRILGVGGHMHPYGTLLRLEDRTAGKVLWESRPVKDSTGEIVAMPITRFVTTLGLPVRTDHVYRLTAVYDNPTGSTIVDGGMGAMGGVFLPARHTVWPAIDRSSAVYRTDYRLTYRLDGMQMGGVQDVSGIQRSSYHDRRTARP